MHRRWYVWDRWRRWRLGALLLCSGCGLLGCLPGPVEPDVTHPYALMDFPEEVRLMALDTQSIDPRVRVRTLRVSPGLHRLRFAYAGPSLQHAGQGGGLLCLETHAGQRYVFEAKTLGLMWRPAIATATVMPGYCTTHACPEGARPVAPPLLALCPDPTPAVRPGS